jgi:hypothetical protein
MQLNHHHDPNACHKQYFVTHFFEKNQYFQYPQMGQKVEKLAK